MLDRRRTLTPRELLKAAGKAVAATTAARLVPSAGRVPAAGAATGAAFLSPGATRGLRLHSDPQSPARIQVGAGEAARAARARSPEGFLDVAAFGAVGGPDRLGARYPTVAAAEAAYPHLTRYLTERDLPTLDLDRDTLDWAAIQEALCAGGAVEVSPDRWYHVSRSIFVPEGQRLVGAGDDRPPAAGAGTAVSGVRLCGPCSHPSGAATVAE